MNSQDEFNGPIEEAEDLHTRSRGKETSGQIKNNVQNKVTVRQGITKQ